MSLDHVLELSRLITPAEPCGSHVAVTGPCGARCLAAAGLYEHERGREAGAVEEVDLSVAHGDAVVLRSRWGERNLAQYAVS